MATATDSIDAIAAQAARVSFARVVVTAIAALCYIPGWIGGRAWLAVVFCALMVRQGWREGTGTQVTTEPPPSG